jgi:hypothetical protein
MLAIYKLDTAGFEIVLFGVHDVVKGRARAGPRFLLVLQS